MKNSVIGILAHVDSGKTTLSEAILYTTGNIRKLGRVDHKDAFLDNFALEQQRGITIFSKQAEFTLNNNKYTLLDTPGHVDFSSEMERVLDVLDYAILVINASDGVQSHTETLWRLLKKKKIPTFIFVNKIDICNSSFEDIMNELKEKISDRCLDFTNIDDINLWNENLATNDETLLEEFIDTSSISDITLSKAIKNRKVFPCYFGSALKLMGIDEFLNSIDKFLLNKDYSKNFGAKVYKITRDNQNNRLTHIKVTGGSIKVRDTVSGTDKQGKEWSEKITQIRVYSGAKYVTVDEAKSGEVCVLVGLSQTVAGEGLGTENTLTKVFLQPVLSYCVFSNDVDPQTLLKYMRILEEEDPQLSVKWNEQLQDIHIGIMGEVQLEILKTIIFDRFNINVKFDKGSIVYKETIANTVEGVGHFEPLRHYAEVHLILEPLKEGSGLVFDCSCSENELALNWQRLIMTHLYEKTYIGVLTGSPITDMKITISAAKVHLKHTEGGDLRQSTYRAVRQGLRQAKSVLLEPWYKFKLNIPSQNLGRALSDMQKLCAEFIPPTDVTEMVTITGKAPVVLMQEYYSEVINYTRGMGSLTYDFGGYRPCHNTEEVIAKINYNCDADIINTADSVFCTNGVGFNVKWNEVHKYMHIESTLKLKKDIQDEYIPKTYTKTAYATSFEEEKELMRIYEMAYGPIKRDINKAFKSVKKTEVSETYTKVQSNMLGEEYLLVDGYNIIFAWKNLSKIAHENLDFARQKLIDILCNYSAYRKNNLILVFDAYKLKGNGGSVEKINNISVVYTKEAETADMYIEKVTHQIGRKYRVRVATSDSLEQVIIFGNGALRVSAQMFFEEVEQTRREIEEHILNLK